MKKKYVFWDIDGTVFSSCDILVSTYREAIEQLNQKYAIQLPVPTLASILSCVGQVPATIFRTLFPDWTHLNQIQQKELSDSILDLLVCKITAGEGEHYPFVNEVFASLHQRGHVFFAASNGRLPYVKAILQKNQTIQYFFEISGVGEKKTDFKDKTELLLTTLKKYQIATDDAVMIGDRESDGLAARQAQVAFIACEYGHGTPVEWEGAIHRITDIKELLPLI